VKYLIDKDLYVPIVKITHKQGLEQRETRLMANRREGVALMVSLILALLSVNEKYWTKFRIGDGAEGKRECI
jgi:hypothetical protein